MHVHTELCCQQSFLSSILPVYTHVPSVLRHQLDTEHQKEWEEAEKEREVKRRAVERARQELETRRRIEARLRAKQEMEEKAKREENGESDGGTARVVHCLVHDLLSFCTSSHTHTYTSSHTHPPHTHPPHTHTYIHILTHTLHTTVKHRTPSPARNPPSRILHVEHLTRPFTIMQLKELLTEDGPMISDGFWTNKIKSHCIVLVGDR